MRRYWIVRYIYNGFEMAMLVYGTEQEMQSYAESELGYTPRYRGATDEEVEASKVLAMKRYIAPQI